MFGSFLAPIVGPTGYTEVRGPTVKMYNCPSSDALCSSVRFLLRS